MILHSDSFTLNWAAMNNSPLLSDSRERKQKIFKKIWKKSHLDFLLLLGVLMLVAIGFGILYSASNQNFVLLRHQFMSFALAFAAMCLLAQIPTYRYQSLVPWVYAVVLLLLFAVIAIGAISKGAQRWLNLGLLRFQPSEIMKLIVPMMLAWYLRNKDFPFAHKRFIC